MGVLQEWPSLASDCLRRGFHSRLRPFGGGSIPGYV